MSIDISQFHETFLEEAGEHLQNLEAGLLELEQGTVTDLNAIFRAAHSIKGGAGTFGFEDIAGFTHVLENLLDKAREGKMELNSELITLMLRSVDVIGDLLEAARNATEANMTEKQACQEALARFLETAPQNSAPPSAVAPTPEHAATAEQCMYHISFKPLPHFAQTGSDPCNIFRELGSLGEIVVKANTGNVPPLSHLNVDETYLSWELELYTDVAKKEIDEVFMFVDGDAEITIHHYAGVDTEAATQAAQHAQEKPAAEASAAAPQKTAPSADNEPTTEEDHRSGKDRRTTPDRRNQSEGQYIRVAIDKIDNLINLVGELVTSNAMVEQGAMRMNMEEHMGFQSSLMESFRHTRNLQEAIMAIRMMPIDFAFSRFPRMVRDTARKLGKQVQLVTEGGHTELDKTVIEFITDPLTHLVRNAVDHGLEPPNERLAAGKNAEGTVTLAAYYRGGNVVIDIKDDGRGLNREKIGAKAVEKGLITAEELKTISDEALWSFIFHSGFSTASVVTDVSGRGVGMDVVRRNIESLGGTISIVSETGKGSTFSISLPLTLAIVDGMAIRVADQTYLIPLLNILESFRPTPEMVRSVQNGVEVIDIRGEYFPLLRLKEVFRIQQDADSTPQTKAADLQGIAILVESGTQRIALYVDELLGERQVVIKSVERNYKPIEGISGATILGDGRVAFILDLPGVFKMASREGRYRHQHNFLGAIAASAAAAHSTTH